MDFVHDRLVRDRRFKSLTMTDVCSREVPVIKGDLSIVEGRVRGFILFTPSISIPTYDSPSRIFFRASQTSA